MYSNNSFYGGQKGKDFIIAKVFPNVAEGLVNDLNDGFTSTVSIGDYVMVSYGLKDTNKASDYISNASKDYPDNYNATLWQKIFIEDEGYINEEDLIIIKATNRTTGFAYKLISSFNNDFQNSLIIKDHINFYTWGTTNLEDITGVERSFYGIENSLFNTSQVLSKLYPLDSIRSDEIIGVNHFVAGQQFVFTFEGYSIYLVQSGADTVCYISDETDLLTLDFSSLNNFSPEINSKFKIQYTGDTQETFVYEFCYDINNNYITKVTIKDFDLFSKVTKDYPLEFFTIDSLIPFQSVYIQESNGVFLLKVIYGNGDDKKELEKEDVIQRYSYWYYKIPNFNTTDEKDYKWDRVQINANMDLQQDYTNVEPKSKVYSAAYINQLERDLRGRNIFTLNLKDLYDNQKLTYHYLYSKNMREKIKDLKYFRVCYYDITKQTNNILFDLLQRFHSAEEDHSQEKLNNIVLISYSNDGDIESSEEKIEIEKEVVSATLRYLETTEQQIYRLSIIYWQPDDTLEESDEKRQLQTGILTITI